MNPVVIVTCMEETLHLRPRQQFIVHTCAPGWPNAGRSSQKEGFQEGGLRRGPMLEEVSQFPKRRLVCGTR